MLLGLALTSLWLMPLGVIASRAAASSDPGAMLQALHLGLSGAVLMTVATVTTNFVNIYMSSLALRSLVPKAGDQLTVWSTGLIAAGLSVFSGAWLDRYASLMVVLGGILVPVGGILVARFYLVRTPVRTQSLYDPSGETAATAASTWPASWRGVAAERPTTRRATSAGRCRRCWWRWECIW